MIARINAQKNVYKEVLNSISQVIRGEDSDRPMDLNLVAEESGQVKIYVRQYKNLQVLHELKAGPDIDIEVKNNSQFVFSSQTLSSLIQSTDSKEVEIELDVDQFEVKIEDGWFTTPTTFDLPLYRESEFNKPLSPPNLTTIATLDRTSLRSNLRMMKTIAPEFGLEIEGDELWFSVNDKVQGSGEVMKEIDNTDVIHDRQYAIEPVDKFLKNIKADTVELSVNNSSLCLSSAESGHDSELLLASRL